MNNPKNDNKTNLNGSNLNCSTIQYRLDTIGLACPLPLLKMKQLLKQAKIGETLFVEASDPASQRDFKSFIAMTPHQLRCEQRESVFLYWITKMSEASGMKELGMKESMNSKVNEE